MNDTRLITPWESITLPSSGTSSLRTSLLPERNSSVKKLRMSCSISVVCNCIPRIFVTVLIQQLNYTNSQHSKIGSRSLDLQSALDSLCSQGALRFTRSFRPCTNSSYSCSAVSGTVATPRASAEGGPQKVCAGTFRLTTVPARITAPSPILTFGRTTQCGPMKTSFSITTFPLLVGLLGPE